MRGGETRIINWHDIYGHPVNDSSNCREIANLIIFLNQTLMFAPFWPIID
jgi:hypothetical protein